MMAKDIENAWNNALDVIKPARITRVGLRYINRIERTAPGETLGEWLVPTDYVPASVLMSSPGFVSLIQTRTDEHRRLNVIIGEKLKEGGEPSSASFIFDIDRIVERDLSVDCVSLLEEATRLHEDVWEVFRSAKSEKLEKLLTGELI